ncbi:MAG: hypothetical protein FWE13_03090 [Firmicutes bacterium]|nr:hypothetical protein [Bacillota bacterium]
MDYLEKFIEKAFNEKPFQEWSEKKGIYVSNDKQCIKKDFVHDFIEKSFEKPTFEEWSENNEIDISYKKPIKYKRNKRIVVRWATAAASLLLLTGIILGIVLSGVLSTTPYPFRYFEKDAIPQSITLDYLYNKEHLLMFNREQILNKEDLEVLRQVVKYEENILLGYTIRQLSFRTADEQSTFRIEFRVRVYRYFMFREYERFDNFTQNFRINSVYIYYRITNNNEGLVRFEYDNIEYFLIIKCFYKEEITHNALDTLLSELFR